MATEVVMPKLGMAMEEGTVSLWYKKTGDIVSKGEVIASISSEKIEMDIESPVEGSLLKIIVQEDQGVPPGTVICYVGNPNEEINQQNESVSIERAKQEVASSVSLQEIAPAPKKTDIKISPVARKMAQTAGLQIETLQGTGPQGRITKEDVERALTKSETSRIEKVEEIPLSHKKQYEILPVTGMRKIIATRMKESLQNSAQLTLNMKVDVTELILLQQQMSEVVQTQYEIKLTLTDFIARAVILSLQTNKQMNSLYIQDQIHIYDHINLGIAVALEKGLVVPVIPNAASCSLVELSSSIKSLADRARKGVLGSEEMKGSTFTITNLGAYGVEHFTPIINTPEAGILGIGAKEEIPVFIEDELQRRSILPLSLTFDHRVLDGAPAANFLRTVKGYLEVPLRMLV